MDYKEKYQQWLGFDEDTKAELLAITDEKEIEDRFYKDLEFGTGGLRGIMGAGANRMNKYTVSKATQGLADYLKAEFDGEKSVAIAHDSRNNSRQFAIYAAEVLCANGIKVYLYDTLMPTPVLSFTVRYLGCTAGAVVTASHNPKEYNGYKIYDETGCQLCPDQANKVIGYVNAIEDLKAVPHMDLEEAAKKGLYQSIGSEVLDAFLKEVRKQSLYEEPSNIKIVYTPLHGTGNIPVRKILEGMNISVVKEQELPDGNFSTVRSPNPEEKDALTLALKQAEREDADLVFGTDPDCDRIGAGVKHDGKYVLITGNQMGALLVNFVLNMKKDSLNSKSTLVKTIVTSELGANIARSFGLQVAETLTGFKYIGDQINRYEKSGDREFIIGYEESYGYMIGHYVRDKDAVTASLLLTEMAAWYHAQGMTLFDALRSLYEKYGWYGEKTHNLVMPGLDGLEKMAALMQSLREQPPVEIGGVTVAQYKDYSDGTVRDAATGAVTPMPLSGSNVLRFELTDGSHIVVRPSGTEPKIKVYILTKGADAAERDANLEKYSAWVKTLA